MSLSLSFVAQTFFVYNRGMAWTIRKDLRGTWRSPNGPVRHIMQDGVKIDRTVQVQESPRKKQEREFRDGRVWQLVPGVTQEHIEAALSSLRIKKRVS